jgi:predicted glycoside hydrolase/deacetylase ChbG (UPF0249 family)
MSDRRLIVNADDLGMTAGVNRGIARAAEAGIVTSASLMVLRRATEEATEWARRTRAVALGLHVDLGEWSYVDGAWQETYVVARPEDGDAVRVEVAAQLDRFRRVTGAEPTHLDSHQHVHDEGVAAAVVAEIGARLGVPVRGRSSLVRHCGDFYGQTGRGDPYPDSITADVLCALIAGLPHGVTELACHPGDGSDPLTGYAAERKAELDALCDPRVRATVERERIALISFADL